MAAAVAGLGVVSGSIAAPVPALFGPLRPTPPATYDTVATWLRDSSAPPDPHTTAPPEVAAFFARLTSAEAIGLAHRFPEIVGNLDGVPAAVRYRANQTRDPRLAGRQILAFDDRADGRIAEVFGDLDAAERVVVLVPGVDTSLDNFDEGLGGVRRRSPAWQARQLFAWVHVERPSARVAVVAWLGYDPPEGFGSDVMREERAAAGAGSLSRFVDGLVLGRPARSVAVVGHSYGSTVAGLAAPVLSGQVSDLVALGSPGLGVGERSELHSDARVWACAAPDDWIRSVPGVRLLGVGHGRLPSDPEFGALPLPCDDVEGHDGYFADGTSSLRALRAIAVTGPNGDLR